MKRENGGGIAGPYIVVYFGNMQVKVRIFTHLVSYQYTGPSHHLGQVHCNS